MSEAILKKLDWDSTFFGKKIWSCHVNKNSHCSLIRENLKGIDFDCCYLFFDHLIQCDPSILKDNHLSIKEFGRKVLLNKSVVMPLYEVDQTIHSYDAQTPISTEILNLAVDSGHASSFKQDTLLAPKFEELYHEWIKNSIKRTIADAVFVVRRDDKEVGLVTARIESNEATVGLLAVSKNYRRLGLGVKLLNKVNEWAFANELVSINIPTQINNDAALSFYKQNGYSVITDTRVFHIWKNEKD